MTTTLNPLELYLARIPHARAAFDAHFGLLPVPQRRRDMARRLWLRLSEQVPGMPAPMLMLYPNGAVTLEWDSSKFHIEADVPSALGGYRLTWCEYPGGNWPRAHNTYSIEPLIRVCQRFVAATAREVR